MFVEPIETKENVRKLVKKKKEYIIKDIYINIDIYIYRYIL